jgi:hypothetical protein
MWEARETENGTVEIIPPGKLASETTTNLVIARIEGRTAERAAAEANERSRFGTVTKNRDGVRSRQIFGDGVTLEFEKPGDGGTILWTNAQFANDGASNRYLMYLTTIHDARYNSSLSWFGTYADAILFTFRLPARESGQEAVSDPYAAVGASAKELSDMSRLIIPSVGCDYPSRFSYPVRGHPAPPINVSSRRQSGSEPCYQKLSRRAVRVLPRGCSQ